MLIRAARGTEKKATTDVTCVTHGLKLWSSLLWNRSDRSDSTIRVRNFVHGYCSAAAREAEPICRSLSRFFDAHSSLAIKDSKSAAGIVKPVSPSRIRSDAPQDGVVRTGVAPASASR